MKNRKKAIIIVLIVLYVLVMFHQLRWYKKMCEAEPFEITLIHDDFFNPFNEKLEIFYEIAKPMIQSLKPHIVNSSKESNGESVTLETFFNLVKKEYNGAWDEDNDNIDTKSYKEIFDKLASEGIVAFLNTGMQKKLGNNMIKHEISIYMASEFKFTKIIKMVPINAYIDKNELCLYTVLCNENDIVIGFLGVSGLKEEKK